MAYENIQVSREGPIATITVNRPKALNALNSATLRELLQAVREAADSSRALILTGAGDKAFVAGADISEMAPMTPWSAREFSELGHVLTAMLEDIPCATIAAVNGYALGGGCELALMCDMIIAGDTARFGQPEVNLGIIPGAGGTQRWPRTAGKYVAMETVLTGAPITASRAHELGIANKVVPAEMTVAIAQRVARQLAEKAPLALRMAKEAVLKAFEAPLAEGLMSERKSFYFLFSTDDQKEGMRAFLEKRKAVFKGR